MIHPISYSRFPFTRCYSSVKGNPVTCKFNFKFLPGTNLCIYDMIKDEIKNFLLRGKVKKKKSKEISFYKIYD